MKKINLKDAVSKIPQTWDPHIAGRVNGTDIRIARIHGNFDWHAHPNEDEAFIVLKGELSLELRDRTIEMSEGDLFVVPRGTQHRPVAQEECWIMLVEPSEVVNTGDNLTSDKTRENLTVITE